MARTPETCAYPHDDRGEHDHADCEDALIQETIDAADVAEIHEVAEMVEQAADRPTDGAVHYLGLDLLPLCDEARIRDGLRPEVTGAVTMTPVRDDVDCTDCQELIRP